MSRPAHRITIGLFVLFCLESSLSIPLQCRKTRDNAETCTYEFTRWTLRCDGRSVWRLPEYNQVESPASPKGSRAIFANDSCFQTIDRKNFEAYAQARLVNLDNNQITYVNNHAFLNFEELENVTLSNNRIRSIQPYAFQGPKKLGVIDLRGNQITRIGEHSFAGAENLRELYLGDNRISWIHPQAFSSLLNLEVLDLGSNELREISWTERLPNLRVLILRNNQLTSFNGSGLKLLPKIENLDLRNNRISSITNSSLFRQREFKYVFLANNQLKYPEPDWFRSSYENAVEQPPDQSFVAGNPWTCDCASNLWEYWHFLINNIRKASWRKALDIECASGSAAGKMLGSLQCNIRQHKCPAICNETPSTDPTTTLAPTKTTTTTVRPTTATTTTAATPTETSTIKDVTAKYSVSTNFAAEGAQQRVYSPPQKEDENGQTTSIEAVMIIVILVVLLLAVAVALIACWIKQRKMVEKANEAPYKRRKTDSTGTEETSVARSSTASSSSGSDGNNEPNAGKAEEEKTQLLIKDSRSTTTPKEVGTSTTEPTSTTGSNPAAHERQYELIAVADSRGDEETVAKLHASPTAIVRPMTLSQSEPSAQEEQLAQNVGVPEADADAHVV